MWTPITDPALSRRCWSVVEEIERCLSRRLSPDAIGERTARNPLLASGEAGVALFYAYLDAARRGSDAADRALDAFERSVDVLGKAPLAAALYSGFCGIGWVAEHLTRELFQEDEDLTAEIDRALAERLSTEAGERSHDLMEGLSGFGTYLIERLPHPGATGLLGRVLDLLAEAAEESEAGLAWYTPPEWLPPWIRELTPGGCYNLGVAHGAAGLIGFLAMAQREGVEDARIPHLADGAIRWLLRQKRPLRDGSVFPAWVIPGREPEPTRTAWCTGDLGIAAVLLSAARSFSRPDWESEAVALARRVSARPVEARKTDEAGLCHGAAGVAHLFNRLYQATGEPDLKEAAVVWYRRCLDRERRGEGLAGLLSWVRIVPGEETWLGEYGFLGGLAGIGLALLAAVSEVEPAWDRVMLVAVPPRS
jgi:hypothetical protein